MRAITTATLAILALGACGTGGAPLLEDELRANGQAPERRSSSQRLPVADADDTQRAFGRVPLPDRMAEIRAARRAEASADPAAVTPLRGTSDVRPSIPSAEPLRGASQPVASPTETQTDPYFEGPAGRVGAPATVGAAPSVAVARPAAPAVANDAPFALRGDAAPETPVGTKSLPATPPGQPRYPLDPAPAQNADDRTSAAIPEPPSDAGTGAQAGATERLPDAFAPDPQSVLASINTYRARFGLAPLSYDRKLSAAALAHVRDLAARGEIASTSRDGAGVLARAVAAGASPEVAGSLVAGGYADVPAAMATWRGDKAQRDRLLLPEANALGLAIHEDRRSPFRYYIEAIVAQVPED